MKLGGEPVTGWSIHALPLLSSDIAAAAPIKVPDPRRGSHFRANINLDDPPRDTFFDMSKHAKGVVWVNGRNLGRYWHIGPQLRLYCPASWLRKGDNVIDIIDLEMIDPMPVRGCVERNTGPVNGGTRNRDNNW